MQKEVFVIYRNGELFEPFGKTTAYLTKESAMKRIKSAARTCADIETNGRWGSLSKKAKDRILDEIIGRDFYLATYELSEGGDRQ